MQVSVWGIVNDVEKKFPEDEKADRLACPLLVFGSLLGEWELGLIQEFALHLGLFLKLVCPFGVFDPVRMGFGQIGALDDVCCPAHEFGS